MINTSWRWRVPGFVLAIVTLTSTFAWANGQEFFAPIGGKIDLVYTGRVRDVNGRYLKDAQIVIWSEEAGLTFPAFSDSYGHYRSLDVGANIREITSVFDPKELHAACALPGYEQVREVKIPKTAHGLVQLDFVLRKVGSADASHPKSEPASAPRVTWLVPILPVGIVVGAAMRR